MGNIVRLEDLLLDKLCLAATLNAAKDSLSEYEDMPQVKEIIFYLNRQLEKLPKE